MTATNFRVRCAALVIWFFAAGVSLSFAASPPSILPDNPMRGSLVFADKMCIRCHAIQGYGGTRGPDLGELPIESGFLGILGLMWNHAPKMISALHQEKLPFPILSTTEMTELTSFLYALNFVDPPGDSRRGEKVFGEKRCSACHSVGGTGGKVGPPLDQYSRFVSPLFLSTALWNKGPAMAEAMEKAGIPRPSLTGRDVSDIVAFIQARAHLGPVPAPRFSLFVQPGNPRKGSRLFRSKGCAKCHSLDDGKPGNGLALAPRQFKVSLATITSRMWRHGPKMWALWRKKKMAPIYLTVEEMADVTAYLYFLRYESPAGDVRRGAALFADRGCAGCHVAKEGRKRIGPDLRTRGPWKSDIDLARQMWNHAANMSGALLGSSREWPKFGEGEVADLLAYVRSIGGTQKAK